MTTKGLAYFPEVPDFSLRLLDLGRLIGEEGACRDMSVELFYVEDKGGTRSKKLDKARKVCAGCPVREECLEYALGTDQRVGVWGGLSERERGRRKKGRAA